MPDIAVLFIIFNRPDTTRKVFGAIRKAQPSRLYIAADAPRPGYATDKEKSEQARAVVQEVDWPCEVKTLFQVKHLGCSLGPRTAFDWFFSNEEEGIILEDDCVPNESFFLFCKQMLEKYRHNDKVISINGCNLGFELNNGNSYTFSRFMNMWGWATWRRSAQKIDYALKDWETVKNPSWKLYTWLRQGLLDTDIHWYQYWRDKFDRTMAEEKITWWDWQWIYHQVKCKQYSVVPARNLVMNIGFHENATHTKQPDNPAAALPTYRLEFPLIHPSMIKPDIGYEEKYVKWVWCYHKRLPVSFYIKQLISRLLVGKKN